VKTIHASTNFSWIAISKGDHGFSCKREIVFDTVARNEPRRLEFHVGYR